MRTSLRGLPSLRRRRGRRQAEALEELEARLMASLVILLNAYFIHRLRGVEGKT
jgi:hypothetical protein